MSDEKNMSKEVTIIQDQDQQQETLIVQPAPNLVDMAKEGLVYSPSQVNKGRALVEASFGKGRKPRPIEDITDTINLMDEVRGAVQTVNLLSENVDGSLATYRQDLERANNTLSTTSTPKTAESSQLGVELSRMKLQSMRFKTSKNLFSKKAEIAHSLLNLVYERQSEGLNRGTAKKLNPKLDAAIRVGSVGALATAGGAIIERAFFNPAPSAAYEDAGETHGDRDIQSQEQTESLFGLNLNGIIGVAIDAAVNNGILTEEQGVSLYDDLTIDEMERLAYELANFTAEPQNFSGQTTGDNQQSDSEGNEPIEVAFAPINPTETPGPIHSVPSFRLNEGESAYLAEQSRLAMEANGQDPNTLDPNRYAYTIGLPTGDMSANLNLDQFHFGDGLLDDSIAAVWNNSREIIAQNLEANPNLQAQLVVAIDNGEAVTAIKLVNGETTTLLIGNSNDASQPLQLVVEEGQTELIIKTNSYLTQELRSRGYQIDENQFIFTAYETMPDGTKAIVSIASTGNEYYTLAVPIVIAEAPTNSEQTNISEIITYSSESLTVYSETGTDRIVASPFIEAEQLEYRADAIKAYQYLMAVNTFGNGRFNGMNIDQMIQILDNISQGNMGEYSTEDFNVTLPQVINLDGSTSTNLTVNLLEVMPRAQIIFTATGATDGGMIQPNSLRFNGLSDQLTLGYSAGGVSESGGIIRLSDGSLALLIHTGNPSRLDDDYIVSNQIVKYSQLFGTQLPWTGNDVFMPEYDSLDTSVSDLIVSISAGPFLWEEDRLERFEDTP